MKKSILTIVGILTICLTISSCGGKKSALEINVSELESACDFVDALGTVVDEMIVLVEDGSLEGEEEEATFKKLMEKGDEIDATAQDSYSREEAEACPNWSKFREKSEKLTEFM